MNNLVDIRVLWNDVLNEIEIASYFCIMNICQAQTIQIRKFSNNKKHNKKYPIKDNWET